MILFCKNAKNTKKRVIAKKGAINKIICFHSKKVLIFKYSNEQFYQNLQEYLKAPRSDKFEGPNNLYKSLINLNG